MPAHHVAWHSTDRELQEVETSPNGRYIRYNTLLGKGACKRVYKALDTTEGREVAWNQVDLLGMDRDEEAQQHLQEEIRVLQQLKHKNVMTFYAWWCDKDNLHINFITELFTAGNLRQYRKKLKVMSENVLKRWAHQILEGLLYLHGHTPPIVHRDLKCDNIFVNSATGEVKIGDLGLATVQQTAMSVVGTPEFMAPEVYDESYDERCDIYSFGMCLLELATAEYPYSECHSVPQIFKKVTLGIPPASLARVSSPELRDFIALCIRHNPSERPEARELLKHPYLESVHVVIAESYNSCLSGSVLSAAGSNGTGTGWNTPSGTMHCAASVRDLREALHQQETMARHLLLQHQHHSSPLEGHPSDAAAAAAMATAAAGTSAVGLHEHPHHQQDQQQQQQQRSQPPVTRSMTGPIVLPSAAPAPPAAAALARSTSVAAAAVAVVTCVGGAAAAAGAPSPSSGGGGDCGGTSTVVAAAGAGAEGRGRTVAVGGGGGGGPVFRSSSDSAASGRDSGSDSDEEVLVPIEVLKAGLLQEGFVDPSALFSDEPSDSGSEPSALTLMDPAVMANGRPQPYSSHGSGCGYSPGKDFAGGPRQPSRGRRPCRRAEQGCSRMAKNSRHQCGMVAEAEGKGAEGEQEEEAEEDGEGEVGEEDGEGEEEWARAPCAAAAFPSVDLDPEAQRRWAPRGNGRSTTDAEAAGAAAGEDSEGAAFAPPLAGELVSGKGSAPLGATASHRRGGSSETLTFSIGLPPGSSGPSTPALRPSYGGGPPASPAELAMAVVPSPSDSPSAEATAAAAAAVPPRYRTPPPALRSANSVGGGGPPFAPNSAPPIQTQQFSPFAVSTSAAAPSPVASCGSVSTGGCHDLVRLPSFRNRVLLTMQSSASLSYTQVSAGSDADPSSPPTRFLRTTSCRTVGGLRLTDAPSFSSPSAPACASGGSGRGGERDGGSRSMGGVFGAGRAGLPSPCPSAGLPVDALAVDGDRATRSSPLCKLEAVPEAADGGGGGACSNITSPARAGSGVSDSDLGVGTSPCAEKGASPVSGLVGLVDAGVLEGSTAAHSLLDVPAEVKGDGGADAVPEYASALAAAATDPAAHLSGPQLAPPLVGHGAGAGAAVAAAPPVAPAADGAQAGIYRFSFTAGAAAGGGGLRGELTVVREFARPIQGIIMRLKQLKRLMGDKVKGITRTEGVVVAAGVTAATPAAPAPAGR